MATSCKPFNGVKKYDSRLVIGISPFYEYGAKWWYCDPWCKPKQGDTVVFWFALKKNIGNIVEDVFRKLDEIESRYSDEIWIPGTETTPFPDLRVIVMFKKDSTRTLHDWGNILCEVFNNECELPYAQREYVEWLNYMGADKDWAVWELVEYKKSAKPTETIRLTIRNCGRVPGKLTVYAIDCKDGQYRLAGCREYTVNAGETFSKEYELVVKEEVDSWQVLWNYWGIPSCSEIRECYPPSKNSFVEVGNVAKPTIEHVKMVCEGKEISSGGTLLVRRSATVDVVVVVKNEGVGGECAVRVWDADEEKAVATDSFYLNSNEEKTVKLHFKADKNRNLKVESLYRLGSDWVVYDSVGC